MLLTGPGATIVTLTTVLGFWLITELLALVQVFVDRSTPWIWSLLAGHRGDFGRAALFTKHARSSPH